MVVVWFTSKKLSVLELLGSLGPCPSVHACTMNDVCKTYGRPGETVWNQYS